MTLIISIATPYFALQVSDRRLTFPNGHIANANAHKTVVFRNELSFSYTGLAEIERQPTDLWIFDTLREVASSRLPEALEHLRVRAASSMRRMNIPSKYKLLAIVGAGYTTDPASGKLVPVLCRIDNFLTGRNKRRQVPGAEFSLTTFVGPSIGVQWNWIDTGYAMQPTESISLQRLLNRIAKRGLGPHPVARVFTDTIRKISARSPSVGSDVLITNIPRACVGTEYMTIMSADGSFGAGMRGDMIDDLLVPNNLQRKDAPRMSFLYVGADDDAKQFSPRVVWKDGGGLLEARYTRSAHE